MAKRLEITLICDGDHSGAEVEATETVALRVNDAEGELDFCALCAELFRLDGLRELLRTVGQPLPENGRKEHPVCDRCGRVLQTPRGLTHHLRSVHGVKRG